MHISEVEKYRNEKDHHMRLGHVDRHDRETSALYLAPYMGERNYHSPEREVPKDIPKGATNIESAGKALGAIIKSGK